MKKLVMLLFLIPLAYGQLYDPLEELTLHAEINSGLHVQANQGAKLDSLSAHLNLVPIEGERQEVLNLEYFSEPNALVTASDGVLYEWSELSNSYSYGWSSDIRVKNEIIPVRSKINFPYDLSDMDEYLLETEFIDITDDIRKKANELVEGETDYYLAVYKIADWTKSNIDYDLNTITAKAVKKSSWVLENKQGVCDELTNLFISMLRSVGIPARFVTGMVYTNIEDKWGNHGWAEVYFPGKGWVPFDITFGQYGWVDPSHLSLGSTLDSGESSVDYKWRSVNLDVQTEPLDLKAELVNEGKKLGQLVRLDIKPYIEDAGFGSYLPIVVTVENLQDYYIGDTIILTKGPEVEDNVRQILLKPYEVKNIAWVSKVPEDLDRKFTYSSILEVKDSFGSSDNEDVGNRSKGELISLEDATGYVHTLVERDIKELFADISINCEYDDREYLSNEDILIDCLVRNTGNKFLDSLFICLNNDCANDEIGIGEERLFNYDVGADENMIFLVENNDLIKKENLKFGIVHVPELYISNVFPERVDYNVLTDLRFSVNSDFEAYDVVLDVNDMEIKFDKLIGEEIVELEMNSKNLVSGLNVEISYKDEKGNEYIDEKNYPIVVENVPFYAKIWRDITGLF